MSESGLSEKQGVIGKTRYRPEQIIPFPCFPQTFITIIAKMPAPVNDAGKARATRNLPRK